MAKIERVSGRYIIDSRGNPTVEAEVLLDDKIIGRASVPSGASTGVHEAVELRDGDKNHFDGRGVLKAVANINTKINHRLVGLDIGGLESIDKIMLSLDGTENKHRLGANAILAVSLACARASALSENLPLYEFLHRHYFASDFRHPNSDFRTLPVPFMNILNGGRHANNGLDFQEYLIAPVGFKNFGEALEAGIAVFYSLKNILTEKGISVAVGDEGGFAPKLVNNFAALDLIVEAVKKTKYHLGKEIFLALDLASSEFYEDGFYYLENKSQKLNTNQMIGYLKKLIEKYPIISLEDPLAEDDWEGWQELTAILGKKVQLVGDDLFVTNVARLKKGIEEKTANAILIKPNQIGSLSETVAAIKLARENGYGTVISHRSGETEDTFIADLAVASSAGQIKTGSLSRTERVSKYNQLLRIEKDLKEKGKYYGQSYPYHT